MRRYTKFTGEDGYIPYEDIVSLSKVYLKTGFKCYYCGKKMSIGISNAPDTCSIDHRIPIVNGGINSLHNLVLCCEECNILKGQDSTVYDGIVSKIERRFPKYRGGGR